MAGGWKILAAAPLLVLAACGGGDSPPPAPTGGGSGGTPPPAPPPPPPAAGQFYSIPAQERLTADDVRQVIAQAAAQADAMGEGATIAVTDRVGNVLAVFRTPGARLTVDIPDAPNGNNADIQGIDVPSEASVP
jgi:hypothetical protein